MCCVVTKLDPFFWYLPPFADSSSFALICTPLDQFIDWPSPIAGFDCVIASEVVEHVADVPKFVSAIAKAAKPNGRIFLTTINRTWASRVMSIWIAEVRKTINSLAIKITRSNDVRRTKIKKKWLHKWILNDHFWNEISNLFRMWWALYRKEFTSGRSSWLRMNWNRVWSRPAAECCRPAAWSTTRSAIDGAGLPSTATIMLCWPRNCQTPNESHSFLPIHSYINDFFHHLMCFSANISRFCGVWYLLTFFL